MNLKKELRFILHLFFITLFSFSCVTKSWSQYRFQGSEYREIRDLSLDILSKCPPRECVLISLGRSPTPFMAFINELLGEDSMIQLPLSMFHYGFTSEKSEISRNSIQDKILKEHFSNHFPSKRKIGKKRIMLVDYTASGKGLASAQRYVGQYLKDIKMANTQIDHVALCTNHSSEENVKELGLKNIIRLGDYPILSKYIPYEAYDQYAQYGSFDISKIANTKNLKKLPKQKKFSKLRKAIKIEMARDSELFEGFDSVKEIDLKIASKYKFSFCQNSGKRKMVNLRDDIYFLLKNDLEKVRKYILKNYKEGYIDEDDVLGVLPVYKISYSNEKDPDAEPMVMELSSYIFNQNSSSLKKNDILDLNLEIRDFLDIPEEASLKFLDIVPNGHFLQE